MRMVQCILGPIPDYSCILKVPSLGMDANPQVGGTCRQEVSKGTDSLTTSLVWEQMVSGYTGPLSTWAW